MAKKKMATAQRSSNEKNLLEAEIEGLLKFRHLMHTSEGFDRDDEKMLTNTIQQKKEALGDCASVKAVLDAFDQKRIDESLQHMEVQLSNRIKVLEMGERQFGLSEKRCPHMYQFFIRKQVVLLKKLNAIKKALHIDPSHTIHRTPGATIREHHPDQKMPLPRQKIVHADAPPAPPADSVPSCNTSPAPGDPADPAVDLLLNALQE